MFSTGLMPNVGKVQMSILAVSRFWKKRKKLEELLEEKKPSKVPLSKLCQNLEEMEESVISY